MQHLILQRMKLLAWCPKQSIFGPLATNPLNLHALIPIQYIVGAYATLVYTQRMKLLAWCPKQSTSATTTSWQSGSVLSIFTTCTRCLQIAQAKVYASNCYIELWKKSFNKHKFKAIVCNSMNIFMTCTFSSQSTWKPYYWCCTIL